MRMHDRSFDGKNICDKTFPGIGDVGKALATPLVVWGSPECRRRGARVKILASIGGPPCAEVSTEGRPRGPGNDMPGHAAHEAQQGGADSRHKAVAAAAADEALPDGIRACGGFPFLNPSSGLEVGASSSGRPQFFSRQHTQHAAAAGGQGDFPIKGAFRAGVALRFAGGYGRMRAEKPVAFRFVPPPPPPSIGGFFIGHVTPPLRHQDGRSGREYPQHGSRMRAWSASRERETGPP